MKILIVDDTIVFRKIITDILTGIPNIEIVGTAANGKIALSKIDELKPDLITLDIEMPEMNGLEVLERVKKINPEIGVIVLSSLTVNGGSMTMKALELGAYDFIPKPQYHGMEENKDAIRNLLIPLVNLFYRRWEIRRTLKGNPVIPSILPKKTTELKEILCNNEPLKSFSPELLLIGISTGGPNALLKMLPKLPADLGVPVLIVQHMPPVFTRSLAESLNSKCLIKAKEAEDNEIIKPNFIYVAPGGKQMKLSRGLSETKIIKITDDPPENNCKPSVDYLFRSVANTFPSKSVAVIMTGMGNDGTLGLRLLKRDKCITIAQDEASCVVFGMPKEAITSGVVDIISPLDNIHNEIIKALKQCDKHN